MKVKLADQVISTKPTNDCGPTKMRIAPCGTMSPSPSVVKTTAEK
jgi:hypothetical protein